jgi:hypothetical protein
MTQPSNDTRSPGSWLALLLGVYAAAFFLPVGDGPAAYGYHLFYVGAVGSVSLVWLPWTWPWLANVVFCVGCVCLATRRSHEAHCGGIVATIMALGYLPYVIGPFGMPRQGLPGVGYWVWVGSMVLLAVAGGAQSRAAERETADFWKHRKPGNRAYSIENRMRQLMAELKYPGYREHEITSRTEADGELS